MNDDKLVYFIHTGDSCFSLLFIFTTFAVRISSQNWESVFFEAWILQIILSEILDVPVTIETGSADKNVNFYDIDTSFDYGTPNDWDSVRMGNTIKDCRKVKEIPNHPEEYVACTHVVPEGKNREIYICG